VAEFEDQQAQDVAPIQSQVSGKKGMPSKLKRILKKSKSKTGTATGSLLCLRCGMICGNKGALVRHMMACKIKEPSANPYDDTQVGLPDAQTELEDEQAQIVAPADEHVVPASNYDEQQLRIARGTKRNREFLPGELSNKRPKESCNDQHEAGEELEGCQVPVGVPAQTLDFVRGYVAKKTAGSSGASRADSSELASHPQAKPQKKIECDQCGKKFASKSSLTGHHKTHIDERPYACEERLCGKRFGCRPDLKRHMMSHTGEKPSACSQCPKRFRDKSALKVHMMNHTGEKPFQCSECLRGFTQKATMQAHLRRHG
jgi:hypothetical protein